MTRKIIEIFDSGFIIDEDLGYSFQREVVINISIDVINKKRIVSKLN
jgi:hypothetical protein